MDAEIARLEAEIIERRRIGTPAFPGPFPSHSCYEIRRYHGVSGPVYAMHMEGGYNVEADTLIGAFKAMLALHPGQ